MSQGKGVTKWKNIEYQENEPHGGPGCPPPEKATGRVCCKASQKKEMTN